MTAEDYYKEGNALSKQGKFGDAITAYLKAIELDPNSPAIEAKCMLDSIMTFYHKDYYNP